MLGRLPCLLLWALLGASPARAEPARFAVDLSAGRALLGAEPVRTHQGTLCAAQDASAPVRVLAAAAVIYARDRGASLWGHASLRFLLCRGGALDDLEFEYYRFSPSSAAFIQKMHGEDRSCPMGDGPYDFVEDEDYLRSLRGSFFLHLNVRPIDCGHFSAQLTKNREIYELWLPLSQEELSALYARNQERYDQQLQRLIAREPIEERYLWFSRSCTWHLRQDLPQLREPAALFPMSILRTLLRQPVELAVTYPSEHALRQLAEAAGGPEALAQQLDEGETLTAERLRPLIRSQRPLSPDLAAVIEDAARAQTPVILAHLAEREEARARR